ncbi:hypothetical protein JZ751_023798 [Albula glossodonta]|uniref:Uncharacterized protein n=1 Tax=Albula glossodonta TaxID=121402 RepID=A0A8T2NHB8_9TELE|nr:hypothetical protein JZ751_023798 [Albula glossodonta]
MWAHPAGPPAKPWLPELQAPQSGRGKPQAAEQGVQGGQQPPRALEACGDSILKTPQD